MKLEKFTIIILITILVGFNAVLLFSNQNMKAAIKLYQKEVSNFADYQREESLRKQAFNLTISGNHLLSTLNGVEKQVLKDKQIVIYIPQSACGLCLDGLLNRYWDDYVSRIAKDVIIFYEDSDLRNIYYIGEKLISHQQIKEIEFESNELITIFFLDDNQELLDLYLFDINSLEFIEPYFKSFCNSIGNGN